MCNSMHDPIPIDILVISLNGNELTCEMVSFDPLITQKCNGTQTGSLINQKFIPVIRLGLNSPSSLPATRVSLSQSETFGCPDYPFGGGHS